MEPETILELSVTCPDEATAMQIGRAAIKARLAACATLQGPARSLFWWNGEVQDDAEWTLILKSRRARLKQLTDLILDRHPYELPVVVTQRVEVTSDVARWVEAETGET